MSILLLIATLRPIPHGAAEQLSFFARHQGLVILQAIAVLVWAVVSVPFVVALGQLLRSKSASLALTATILSAVGILLLGFAIFTHVGAFLAIIAAGSAPSAADAAYQAAVWGNLSFYAGWGGATGTLPVRGPGR